MSRHLHHKYGDLTSEEVRATLLSFTVDFVREVRAIAGVRRIALLGSLITAKPFPKDADVLVTITAEIDFDRLARHGRRLKGRAQGLNSGADVFVADQAGSYIGRVCHYRECYPRRACRARNCGKVLHLNDDLETLTLARELVAAPPLVVFPSLIVRSELPSDVRTLLIDPLTRDIA